MIKIIISEINLLQDYVRLRNDDSVKINLKDWHIIDTTLTNQKRHEFTFLKDFFLQPGAAVKIWSGVGDNDAKNIYQNRHAPIWNNPGDTATLYDLNGNKIAELTVGNPPKGGRGGGTKPPIPPKSPVPIKITISGFVNDAVCKQGIANAKLVFQVLKGQKETETNTDENGHYETKLTGGRDYTVIVSAKNYNDFSDIINTKVGKDMSKNFGLEPNFDIELDVDSTEVKFTRKDDNLVEVVKQLAKDGKITVDINTNYTFTVKLAITKGMTDKIRATLLENGKSLKIPNIADDVMCRISKDNTSLTLTFNPVKTNWAWYKRDWLTVASPDKTEKAYNYSVLVDASYGNNIFNNNFNLGSIIVKVNKEKLDALFWYNLFLIAEGGFLVAAVIAAVVVVILAWPVLAEELGLVGAAATSAGIASAILGLLGKLTELPKAEKDKNLRKMDDPPQFDKNYKQLIKIPHKVHTLKANIKRFFTMANTMMISRDRLYSAHNKKDKVAITRQMAHFKKLLKENKSILAKITHYVNNAEKRVKKSGIFNLKTISKVRELLRQNKVPTKLILAKLKTFKVSKAQIELALKTIKNNKITDGEFLVLSKLRKLSANFTKSNNLFEKNILKEVKWYSKIY
ncbi:MAG: lamin tail domain-containing protein [DPANN group archaeon]|nr:lamin tail domain-containing protein [DPANN group archaeon]